MFYTIEYLPKGATYWMAGIGYSGGGSLERTMENAKKLLSEKSDATAVRIVDSSTKEVVWMG